MNSSSIYKQDCSPTCFNWLCPFCAFPAYRTYDANAFSPLNLRYAFSLCKRVSLCYTCFPLLPSLHRALQNIVSDSAANCSFTPYTAFPFTTCATHTTQPNLFLTCAELQTLHEVSQPAQRLRWRHPLSRWPSFSSLQDQLHGLLCLVVPYFSRPT